MSEVKPLNPIPLQQFIDKVKVADASKTPELRLTLQEAKILAFTLGEVMSRLHGDLEKLIDQQNKTEEVINVAADGGQSW
jgi:hypothetical protein|tara:strand:+ start:753 stop:992 length:240 start_codon:yes stop_codon:yes gene_type:complete